MVPDGAMPDMLTVFLETQSGFVFLLIFSTWVGANSRLEESGVVECAPQERGTIDSSPSKPGSRKLDPEARGTIRHGTGSPGRVLGLPLKVVVLWVVIVGGWEERWRRAERELQKETRNKPVCTRTMAHSQTQTRRLDTFSTISFFSSFYFFMYFFFDLTNKRTSLS